MTTFDLADPRIRKMICRNHLPEEVWSPPGHLFSVECATCGQAWPCPPSVAVGEWRYLWRGRPVAWHESMCPVRRGAAGCSCMQAPERRPTKWDPT